MSDRAKDAREIRAWGKELAEDLVYFIEGWNKVTMPASDIPAEVPVFDEDAAVRVFAALVASGTWTPGTEPAPESKGGA